MPAPPDLAEALRDLPPGRLCVGFSGGLDSTVLLQALAADPRARAQGLRAWHVHHGLHPQADAWLAHCRRFCAERGLELSVSRVSVARGDGDGPEAAARRARHAAFAAGLAPGETLLLAHHRDDQAETLLLRLLRGSGADGLGAMRAWRSCGPGRLWRPLLALPRASLHAYARAEALDWIEDPSNDEDAFDRNFLRHRVLPLLRQRWPQADAAFAQSASLSAQAAALLEQDDALALAQVRSLDPQALSRARLRALPPARAARVLRRWIAALGLPPLPQQGVVQIQSHLLDARADAQAAFAWRGAVVQAWRDLLHAGPQREPLPAQWACAWDGAAPLDLPGGGQWRLEGACGFAQPLRAHARQGGERIALPGRSHSHTLKHALQACGVPPWERLRLPLLSSPDGRVQAAGDLLYSAQLDAWLRERSARLYWQP